MTHDATKRLTAQAKAFASLTRRRGNLETEINTDPVVIGARADLEAAQRALEVAMAPYAPRLKALEEEEKVLRADTYDIWPTGSDAPKSIKGEFGSLQMRMKPKLVIEDSLDTLDRLKKISVPNVKDPVRLVVKSIDFDQKAFKNLVATVGADALGVSYETRRELAYVAPGAKDGDDE